MAVDVVDSVCARPGTAFKQLWLAIVPLHESAYNGRGCERLRMADGTGGARCVSVSGVGCPACQQCRRCRAINLGPEAVDYLKGNSRRSASSGGTLARR
jgi:hypothetical protein